MQNPYVAILLEYRQTTAWLRAVTYPGKDLTDKVLRKLDEEDVYLDLTPRLLPPLLTPEAFVREAGIMHFPSLHGDLRISSVIRRVLLFGGI